MSVSQMVAINKRLLSVFACASSASIDVSISRVWMATLAPGATCPAKYTVLLWITACDMRGPVSMRLIVMVTPLRCSYASAYTGYTIHSRPLQALWVVCKSDNSIDGETHGVGNSRAHGDRLCFESGTRQGVRPGTRRGWRCIGHQWTQPHAARTDGSGNPASHGSGRDAGRRRRVDPGRARGAARRLRRPGHFNQQ